MYGVFPDLVVKLYVVLHWYATGSHCCRSSHTSSEACCLLSCCHVSPYCCHLVAEIRHFVSCHFAIVASSHLFLAAWRNLVFSMLHVLFCRLPCWQSSNLCGSPSCKLSPSVIVRHIASFHWTAKALPKCYLSLFAYAQMEFLSAVIWLLWHIEISQLTPCAHKNSICLMFLYCFNHLFLHLLSAVI